MGDLCVGPRRNEFLTFLPRNGRLDRENDKFLWLERNFPPAKGDRFSEKLLFDTGLQLMAISVEKKKHFEGELFPLKNE